MSFVIVIAIVIAITLGYFTNINIGFYSIGFAYLIGSFMLPLKPGDIVLMWPLKIFFILFAVTLFYNFALINGTLEKLALYILYKCRRYPSLLPFVIYLIAFLLAGMGAGFYAAVAFLCPLTLMLCERTGMSRVLGALAVSNGAIGGTYIMNSMGGVIAKELIAKAGYVEQASIYGFDVFMGMFLYSLVAVVVIYFFTKGYKLTGKNITIEKPEDFTREQRINLYLILAMVVVVLAPSIAGLILPNSPAIKLLQAKIDIGFVALLAAVAAFILKLGDEKQVLNKVPWGTIIMICGVGILIEIAVRVGTVKLLASWVGTNIPAYLLPVAMAAISGAMSLFSSTLGVVLPTIYPLVPEIALTSGVSPAILFTAIVVGGVSTGMCPFSSGGSLTLASCPNDEAQKELFPYLMFVLPPIMLAISVILIYVLQLFI